MSKKKQFEITQSMEESASRVNENRKRLRAHPKTNGAAYQFVNQNWYAAPYFKIHPGLFRLRHIRHTLHPGFHPGSQHRAMPSRRQGFCGYPVHSYGKSGDT